MTTSTLEDKIHELFDRLEAVVPDAPRFDDLRGFECSDPPHRLLIGAGVAALLVVSVGGVALVSRRDAAAPSAPADTPPADVAVTTASAPAGVAPNSAGNQLISTPLAADAIPYAVLDQPGWRMTNLTGASGGTWSGGFEGATLIVGEGPLFDAPLFAVTPVPLPGSENDRGTVPSSLTSMEAINPDGVPIEVAGVTGSVSVTQTDIETGIDGPIVLMFWPIDGGQRLARVNATRMSVDEVVALADQVTFDGDQAQLPAQPGFRALPIPELGRPVSDLSITFERDGGRIELVGSNQSGESLMGRMASNVLTTKVVDGVELGWRPQLEHPGDRWVDWLQGEWSFYAMSSGFESDQQFLDTMASFRLSDPATFASMAAESGTEVVMPGAHPELAGDLFQHVEISDEALRDATTNAFPTGRYYFDFELISGASCLWARTWLETADAALRDAIESQIETLATSLDESGYTGLSDILNRALLAPMRSDDVNQVAGIGLCPAWTN